MPTYEYECEACGHKFEAMQKFSDKPVKTCPKCSKRKVKRLISNGTGIIFKGSGFYETDYKRKRSEGACRNCPAGGGCGAKGED